jgi:hypothetical protein
MLTVQYRQETQMTGYEPERTLYKLDFSQTKHNGLQVTTASVTMGELLEFAGMADAAEGGRDAKAGQVLLERFASVLEDWNVTRGGEPVPATYEGLLSQEFGFVMFVISAWISEMAQAPPPLPGSSSSGGTSEAVPPPAVVSASRSLASLQEPS